MAITASWQRWRSFGKPGSGAKPAKSDPCRQLAAARLAPRCAISLLGQPLEQLRHFAWATLNLHRYISVEARGRQDGHQGKVGYPGSRPLQPHIISPPSLVPSPPNELAGALPSVASKFHLHSRPELACEPTSQKTTRATAPAPAPASCCASFDLTTARQADKQPASQPASVQPTA